MKKLSGFFLIVLTALLLSTPAMAAPFMVCDPQTGVTHYKLTGPAWLPTTVTAQPDGSLRVDVVTAIVGTNNTTVQACRTTVEWPEVCSVVVPFVFTRPAAPSSPAGIKLSP